MLKKGCTLPGSGDKENLLSNLATSIAEKFENVRNAQNDNVWIKITKFCNRSRTHKLTKLKHKLQFTGLIWDVTTLHLSDVEYIFVQLSVDLYIFTKELLRFMLNNIDILCCGSCFWAKASCSRFHFRLFWVT